MVSALLSRVQGSVVLGFGVEGFFSYQDLEFLTPLACVREAVLTHRNARDNRLEIPAGSIRGLEFRGYDYGWCFREI